MMYLYIQKYIFLIFLILNNSYLILNKNLFWNMKHGCYFTILRFVLNIVVWWDRGKKENYRKVTAYAI